MLLGGSTHRYEIHLDTGVGEVVRLRGEANGVTVRQAVDFYLRRFDSPDVFRIVSVKDWVGNDVPLSASAHYQVPVYVKLQEDVVSAEEAAGCRIQILFAVKFF